MSYVPPDNFAQREPTRGASCVGFTLVELLVVISIISLLTSMLLPALGRARQHAKAALCRSNLRQLGIAVAMYALDENDYLVPAYQISADVHWWGKKLSNGIDHKKGPVWPYLASDLKEEGIYECPAQPYGSYQQQGKPAKVPDGPQWITSTYGYNGYYLSSPMCPWRLIGRPWQMTTTVKFPAQVFAFADTLMDWSPTGDKRVVKNNALLDPPLLFRGTYWTPNTSPTTSFRHLDKTQVVFVDGHCDSMGLEGGKYASERNKIGSVGRTNAPYYVPDYKQWIK